VGGGGDYPSPFNTKDMKNIFIGDKKVTRDSILDKDRGNRKMVSLRGEGFDEDHLVSL